jgi:hypothetical protein
MSAAVVTAAASAARAAAERKEEELMTPYTPNDLAEGWEFKILRSTSGGFGNPDRLRAVLAEEGRAGWTLVEKFDNARVRLKRPASARAGDAALDFDARRTYIRPGLGLRVVIGLIMVCGVAAAAIVIAVAVVRMSH